MSEYIGNIIDSNDNILYPEVKRWHKYGLIGQGADKNINIIGHADLIKYNPKFYRVEYSAYVSLNQTIQSDYTHKFGFDIHMFRQLCDRQIYPVQNNGHWLAYDSNWRVIRDLTGYGTVHAVESWGDEPRFVSFARIYETSNYGIGAWPSWNFPVGTFLEGWFLATE